MASFTIHLHNIRIFAHHGVFDEEIIVGNEFEVNLMLYQKAPKEKVTSLDQTINYAAVYKLVKERFAIPTPLLETLATEIAEGLHERFPGARKIRLQITKLHPPIVGFTGSVGITFTRRFNKRNT